MTLLAEDIAELLHGEGGSLDLSELLILLEVASGKLYEMGSVLVGDSDEKEQLKLYFSSIRILVAAAHKRLEEIRQESCNELAGMLAGNSVEAHDRQIEQRCKGDPCGVGKE